MKVHHNILKKAKAVGLDVIVEATRIVIKQGDKVVTSGTDPKAAVEFAIRQVVAAHPVTQAMAKSADKRIARSAEAAITKAKPKVKKEQSAHEEMAREHGWTAKRGGGFVNKDEELESEAKSWKELCEEQDIEVEDSGSVVKAKYKERYRPHKGTCGDDLAKRLQEQFLTEEGEDGKPRLDRKAFQKFAEDNEVWVAAYKSMQSGLVRMNVANRLRAKVRKGHEIVGLK